MSIVALPPNFVFCSIVFLINLLNSMKLLNTLYNAGEEAQLSEFIKEHQIADYKDRALVKVFAAVYDIGNIWSDYSTC
jgi:hypothetical protein